jgi:hypothetical protein
MPRDGGYSPAEWAKYALEQTRQFLVEYYAARPTLSRAAAS